MFLPLDRPVPPQRGEKEKSGLSDPGAVLAFTARPGVDHNTTEHPQSRPLCDDKKQDHSVIMSAHGQKQELTQTTKITEIFSNLANE